MNLVLFFYFSRFFVIADASLIIILAAVNLLYNMWDIKLKSDEIYKRTEFILSEIKGNIS